MNEKKMVYCDMHKKDVSTEQIWTYKAGGVDPKDYKEEYQFCSYECMLAYLVDDEKVLKLKLRRMNVDRAIRHPHSLSRAVTKVAENEYLLEADEYTAKETVHALDFENMSREEIEKTFTKAEVLRLDECYAD